VVDADGEAGRADPVADPFERPVLAADDVEDGLTGSERGRVPDGPVRWPYRPPKATS
jgi:hypothetical protein